MTKSATKCAAALLMLGAQIAAGMPTPASTDFPAVELAQRSKTYQGDDPNLSGARIAGDDEVPPVGARDLSMLERSLAPTATYSTDHKYTVKHSCDTDQSIPKIFLYASDFQANAKAICDNTFALFGAEMIKPGAAAYQAETKIKGRDKIAATIWHKGTTAVVAGVQNLAMPSTVDAKKEAYSLCMDAVNYIGNQCTDGISDGVHQEVAWRTGSATWSDSHGHDVVLFTFSEQNA